MLKFHRIINALDTHYPEFIDLYSDAFPPSQQRNATALEFELLNEPRFFAHVLINNSDFVGLFNYWAFDRFYYIEHLAIVPDFQNQGFGSEVMERFKKDLHLPVVFEVEMPSTPSKIGRIRFYEKLGFNVLSHKYAQPPYQKGQFLLPMLLMSNDIHFADTHFNLIKETLYKNVYHYQPEEINNEDRKL